ncbi:MAG TPA: YggT family protein [Nitrospiria bacterium]|nr:YggT family protein [Nitrospiria bacterium]
MFIFGNFLNAFAKVLDMALYFFMWVIIIRALITWVNPDPYNPIVQFLTRVTEPILSPIRRLLPTYRIGVDLSPFIAILIIYFMRDFLIRSLMEIAIRF